MDPLQQARAILKVVQLLLAVVVAVPRAIVEGLTEMTIPEFQASVAHWDIAEWTRQFMGFVGVVAAAVVTVLKVLASVTSAVIGIGSAGATSTTMGTSSVGGTEDIFSNTASFLVNELLPTIADGFVLLVQQFLNLMLEGGSAIMSTM
eukprot:CAMPEP_0178750232 /NCGR_PEP_ID=MMETSP0744-20121128/9853_1 /TAXON_ID=913974 /ORGANISM="Nitzschia punctata, Strain CCMP561" /LENGTH=147 /DNA_ID=CAMNT_0020403737 /DNA_START=42 /DNA_END=485 /DNA_ORIENTATION=-